MHIFSVWLLAGLAWTANAKAIETPPMVPTPTDDWPPHHYPHGPTTTSSSSSSSLLSKTCTPKSSSWTTSSATTCSATTITETASPITVTATPSPIYTTVTDTQTVTATANDDFYTTITNIFDQTITETQELSTTSIDVSTLIVTQDILTTVPLICPTEPTSTYTITPTASLNNECQITSVTFPPAPTNAPSGTCVSTLIASSTSTVGDSYCFSTLRQYETDICLDPYGNTCLSYDTFSGDRSTYTQFRIVNGVFSVIDGGSEFVIPSTIDGGLLQLQLGVGNLYCGLAGTGTAVNQIACYDSNGNPFMAYTDSSNNFYLGPFVPTGYNAQTLYFVRYE